MKKTLKNKITGEEYGKITIGGHTVTIEECAIILDVKIMQTEEDYMMGNGVDIEELELV